MTITDTRPAIAFDAAAFRQWLTDTDDDLPTVADHLGVDDEFGQTTNYGDGIAPTLHELLRTLHGDGEFDAPGEVWALRPDVVAVAMFRTCDGDGIDGGAVFTVDLANGVRLATLHQAHDAWTADEETTGVDAAVEAVGHVVDVVNEAVAAYDASRAGS